VSFYKGVAKERFLPLGSLSVVCLFPLAMGIPLPRDIFCFRKAFLSILDKHRLLARVFFVRAMLPWIVLLIQHAPPPKSPFPSKLALYWNGVWTQ